MSDEGEINIGISVMKGNTELKDAIDSVLSTMTADDFNALMDEAIAIQPLSEAKQLSSMTRRREDSVLPPASTHINSLPKGVCLHGETDPARQPILPSSGRTYGVPTISPASATP